MYPYQASVRKLTCYFQNPGLLRDGPQSLAALVDGASQNTTVNPPSTGWPTGEGFFIEFARSATETGSIIAQSEQFTIGVVNVSSTLGPTSSSS